MILKEGFVLQINGLCRSDVKSAQNLKQNSNFSENYKKQYIIKKIHMDSTEIYQ